MSVPFKARLRGRRTTWLVNTDHASPGLVDFVAELGVDAVMIDCEQGPPSFEDVENMTRAARLHGAAAIVRVPSADPQTIGRYLSRGIDGLVVPRLDTAAQVSRTVAEIRYCAPLDFDDKVIIVEVESIEAARQIDGFLAVPEVDCFFVGPVDLAKSMGYGGDYSQPAVLAELDRVIARTREAGRCVGAMVKEHDLRDWQRKGATMLYTHVNDFVAAGLRQWRAIAGTAADDARGSSDASLAARAMPR